MKYRVILEYEIDFDRIPDNLIEAIEDSLQIRDNENYLRSLKSLDWSATVILIGKTIEVI